MCDHKDAARPLSGVPPSRRRIEVPLVGIFDFDGDLPIAARLPDFLEPMKVKLVDSMRPGNCQAQKYSGQY
jgi:hypothetical protein